MITENAPGTMNNTNKQIRFEGPTLTPIDWPSTLKTRKTQSPKGCALSFVRIFVATLRRHLSRNVQQAVESNIDVLYIRNLRKTTINFTH